MHASAYSIGQRRRRPAAKQLGRRIGQRRLDARRVPPDGLRDRERDAEVDQHRAGEVLRHKDVRRLHIAVHDSVLMDEVECIGDLGERRSRSRRAVSVVAVPP